MKGTAIRVEFVVQKCKMTIKALTSLFEHKFVLITVKLTETKGLKISICVNVHATFNI